HLDWSGNRLVGTGDRLDRGSALYHKAICRAMHRYPAQIQLAPVARRHRRNHRRADRQGPTITTMDMHWEPVEVFAPSQLAWEVHHASVEDGDWAADTPKIVFRATYRPGSQGSPDARFMKAITGAALANGLADVVLFDFMDLDYRWGDTLMGLFQVVDNHDREFPVGCVGAAGP